MGLSNSAAPKYRLRAGREKSGCGGGPAPSLIGRRRSENPSRRLQARGSNSAPKCSAGGFPFPSAFQHGFAAWERRRARLVFIIGDLKNTIRLGQARLAPFWTMLFRPLEDAARDERKCVREGKGRVWYSNGAACLYWVRRCGVTVCRRRWPSLGAQGFPLKAERRASVSSKGVLPLPRLTHLG
ncbi:hypothetical protein MRX96_017936 [Rhipicephalus microplus]